MFLASFQMKRVGLFCRRIGMSLVSKRFTITVPDSVYEDLEHWSDQQGRPAANLAAFLVEVGILAAKERGEIQAKNTNATSQGK